MGDGRVGDGRGEWFGMKRSFDPFGCRVLLSGLWVDFEVLFFRKNMGFTAKVIDFGCLLRTHLH